MYEQFYGLREKPFALTPDPAYLYLAKRHRHALTMLEYVLSEASGFALITGEVGCGKTTVVRHFLERTQQPLNVGFITNTHPGFGNLLPWIMEALGMDVGQGAASEQYRQFVGHIKREYDAGRRAVLVIDEAQNLGVAGLEELRVLSNLNAGKHMLLQTILIGQPELRATLGLQQLRQLAQRIAIDHHLEALRAEETVGYVRHRLAVAGGRPDIFTPEALDLIHDCTGGIPRLVNLVCDTSLVYGFSDQQTIIAADLVEQVVADRASGGLLPLKVAGKAVRGPLAAV
ncbi:MAG: type secretory pathway, component ExeA [Gammaproteobacteria bacterium]|nr:type secretory pathway, component ExeA [Gammaproteobacteria bacterium]